MAVNRYPAQCVTCGARVPAMGGVLRKGNYGWEVQHLACSESGESEVIEIYFPSTGNYATINRAGRCLDSPCCGCCSA